MSLLIEEHAASFFRTEVGGASHRQVKSMTEPSNDASEVQSVGRSDRVGATPGMGFLTGFWSRVLTVHIHVSAALKCPI
jgi:hypothetical protein